jgi:hypothetical protein
VSLRGLTQGILGNLNENEQLNYSELTRALSDRFDPPDQMELYRIQLREKQQKASESLPELGQNIRRLTNLAYPTVPCDVRETLAKDQFIDVLPSSEMRLRIKQARPVNLNGAVRHAVELEAYFKAEGKLRESKEYLHIVNSTSADNAQHKNTDDMRSILSELRESMKKMEEKIKALETTNTSQNNFRSDRQHWRKNITCHNYGGRGYIQRECKKQKVNLSKERVKEKRGSTANLEQRLNCGINGYLGNTGLFIETRVENESVSLLVDTGASLTIISKKIFDKLSREHYLDPIQSRVQVVRH